MRGYPLAFFSAKNSLDEDGGLLHIATTVDALWWTQLNGEILSFGAATSSLSTAMKPTTCY